MRIIFIKSSAVFVLSGLMLIGCVFARPAKALEIYSGIKSFFRSIGNKFGTLSDVPSLKGVDTTMTTPVVVVGGGIAGLTAALYCSQAHIPCVVIEGPKPGGALSQSHSVRNWPGIIEAPGGEIVKKIRDQVVASGVTITNEKVVECNLSAWPREITVQSIANNERRKLKALSVILAMGTEPNLLGIPGESGPDGYWGKGVSNCAVCEGSLYTDKTVAVIGGGDAAITEADYLADIAKKVYILVRKDFFRAKDIRARDKVLARANVEVLFNTEVKKIMGDGSRVTHIMVHNNKDNREYELAVNGFFLAIGSRPNTNLIKGQIALDEYNFVVLKNYQESSLHGVYAAGDMADHEFVQAITASSDGCKAALQAIKFIKELDFESSINRSLQQNTDVEVVSTKEVDDIREIRTQQDFDDLVVHANKPVVIDVFTRLCIPCQQMMPIFCKMAREFSDQVSFVKINPANKAFKLDELLSSLGGKPLDVVPTFIFVNHGCEIARVAGIMDEITFSNLIQKTVIDRK